MDEIAEKIKIALENGEQFESSMIDMSQNTTVEIYNERMRGVYEDMYDLGYI